MSEDVTAVTMQISEKAAEAALSAFKSVLDSVGRLFRELLGMEHDRARARAQIQAARDGGHAGEASRVSATNLTGIRPGEISLKDLAENARKQGEIAADAEQITVTIDRSYSAVPVEDLQLKGTAVKGKASILLQALARLQAAAANRKKKILKLQAENKEDQRMIRKLEAVCDQLRQEEIIRKIGHLCSSGNEMTTGRINKLLDFCEQAGDALTDVTVEQLLALIHGSAGTAMEMTAESQKTHDTE